MLVSANFALISAVSESVMVVKDLGIQLTSRRRNGSKISKVFDTTVKFSLYQVLYIVF